MHIELFDFLSLVITFIIDYGFASFDNFTLKLYWNLLWNVLKNNEEDQFCLTPALQWIIGRMITDSNWKFLRWFCLFSHMFVLFLKKAISLVQDGRFTPFKICLYIQLATELLS